MDIQSIAVSEDKHCSFKYIVTALYENGEKKEFVKCPFFFKCNLYHSTDIENCPATGKSIAEEVRRQEKEARREEKKEIESIADDARWDYLRKHLYGWRHEWRAWMLVLSGFSMYLIFYGERYPLWIVLLSGTVFLLWAIFWMRQLKKHRELVIKNAGALWRHIVDAKKTVEA